MGNFQPVVLSIGRVKLKTLGKIGKMDASKAILLNSCVEIIGPLPSACRRLESWSIIGCSRARRAQAAQPFTRPKQSNHEGRTPNPLRLACLTALSEGASTPPQKDACVCCPASIIAYNHAMLANQVAVAGSDFQVIDPADVRCLSVDDVLDGDRASQGLKLAARPEVLDTRPLA